MALFELSDVVHPTAEQIIEIVKERRLSRARTHLINTLELWKLIESTTVVGAGVAAAIDKAQTEVLEAIVEYSAAHAEVYT